MKKTVTQLNAYREIRKELKELEEHLEMVGTTGAPTGCRGVTMPEALPGTNDPAAAARQLADGLEVMIDQHRSALAELYASLSQVMAAIRDFRTLMVVQLYYFCGETDAEIGLRMNMSTSRVNQLRRGFLHSL